MNHDPRTEYTARLKRHSEALAANGLQADRIANGRLAVFLGGASIAAGAYWGPISYSWLAVPVVAFVVLMFVHERVLRARSRAERLVALYERGIARLDDAWHGTGSDGLAYMPQKHVYASDLDILGEGSVFQWMNTARSGIGEATLAEWLCAPADLETVAARQEAARELTPHLDLREALALLGDDVRAAVHPEILRKWGQGEQTLRIGRWRFLAFTLMALSLAMLGVWITSGFFGPFVLVFIVDMLFLGAFSKRIAHIERMAGEPRRELTVLTGILDRLESETFTCNHLRDLQKNLTADGTSAAQRLRQLDRAIYLLEAPRNAIFLPVAIPLMWPLFAAAAVEQWRLKYGKHLEEWCASVGAFEALCSLANNTYENPEAIFPELVEDDTCFTATQIAHPLLAKSEAVHNDVSLTSAQPLLMISGSNMSGKSTMLRAVGVNTVIALAGAPVRAKSLRLSRLQPGANMRVHDSVQEGTSRFYAEILRLKQLQDLAAQDVPLLFLLDELLHGTNSHDRAIGAAGIIHHFMGTGAIGMVTSHDLALTEIASTLAPRATNKHFRDDMEGAKLSFDYTLRDGVVDQSNALALMRATGLHVDDA